MLREAGSAQAEAGRQGSVPAEASASWRALGTLVQLVVTDPRCLPEARRLLAAELDAVDAACSRFRPDSEICSLRAAQGHTAQGHTAQGHTAQGDTAQGDTAQGDTAQGDTAQGDTAQGDTAQ